MLFNTITTNGCLFGGETGGLSFNWAIKTIYNGIANSDACTIVGHATVGTTKVAVVGSNSFDATLWTPLYIQPVDVATSHVVIGDAPVATASASGAKLFVKGRISNDSAIRILDNSTSYHEISGLATTGSRTHSFQDSSGTIAHVGDNIKTCWSSVAGVSADGVFHHFIGKSLNKFQIIANIDVPDSVLFRIIDLDNGSAVVALISKVYSDGAIKIYETTTITNNPTTDHRLAVEYLKSYGAGTSVIYSLNAF